MQPDIKKLISAFLSMAILASTLSLSIMHSGLFTNKASSQGISERESLKSAFADISLITPPWRTQPTSLPTSQDFLISSNLTESFSQAVSQELLLASSKGSAPNTAFLQNAVKKIESQAIQLPSIDSSDIKINNEATLDDKLAYIKTVSEILSVAVKNPVSITINGSRPDIEKVLALQNRFADQYEKIAALSVPTVMVPLQKSLLSFAMSHQSFFESLANYESDPVKSLLTLQKKESILGAHMTALNQELEKVDDLMKLGLEKPDSSWWIADSMAALFLPEVAHATLPVVDLGSIAQTIAQVIQDAIAYAKDIAHYIATEADAALKWIQTKLEWARKLATEALKNVLVQLFVQQAIAWVNGGGNPQFVTNWRSYADTAARMGMNKGFSSISDEACGTFGPLMINNLNNSFNNYYAPSNCQPNALGQSLNRFRTGNFSDGGWSTYGAAIGPQGNYFHSYTNYATRIGESSEKEREAQINKIVDGFKPTETCPESEPFVGPPEQNQTPAEEQNQSQAPVDPLPDGSCEDGSEPAATTPGIAFTAALQNAITVPTDRVVTADDLLGLSFTLANGALVKAMAAKSQGITSLGEGAAFRTGANQTSSLSDICSSYTPGTPGYTTCLESIDSAGAVETDLENDIANDQALQNLRAEAQSIGQNRSSLTAANNESLSIIKEFLVEYFDSNGRRALAERVENVCSQLGTSNPDRARIDEIRSTKADIEILRDLTEQINTTNQDLLATDLSILSRSNDAVDIRTRFSQFTTTYGTLASTTQLLMLAQTRRGELQTVKSQAVKTIENPCDTAIQRITPALLVNP